MFNSKIAIAIGAIFLLNACASNREYAAGVTVVEPGLYRVSEKGGLHQSVYDRAAEQCNKEGLLPDIQKKESESGILGIAKLPVLIFRCK